MARQSKLLEELTAKMREAKRCAPLFFARNVFFSTTMQCTTTVVPSHFIPLDIPLNLHPLFHFMCLSSVLLYRICIELCLRIRTEEMIFEPFYVRSRDNHKWPQFLSKKGCGHVLLSTQSCHGLSSLLRMISWIQLSAEYFLRMIKEFDREIDLTIYTVATNQSGRLKDVKKLSAFISICSFHLCSALKISFRIDD